MALQIQFCLTISVFQTFQTLCFSKLLLNCLGQSTANLCTPAPKAYIVDGLLLFFSLRHHQAGKLPFYFFWCSSILIFSLCTFCKLTRHFSISRIFNGWSRGITFSIIILNFVCTVFVSSFSAMHLKFSCTLFFSYVYHLFLFPVFFLPNLIFFLLFFPQWNFSSSCTFFYYT